MITAYQIAVMGADEGNADVPPVAPEWPWEPWHSPVMVLAGCDASGTHWLWLAARCGWFIGFAPQHSPAVLAEIAATHTRGCAACQKYARPAGKGQPEPGETSA